jgi:hypothetical protein
LGHPTAYAFRSKTSSFVQITKVLKIKVKKTRQKPAGSEIRDPEKTIPDLWDKKAPYPDF